MKRFVFAICFVFVASLANNLNAQDFLSTDASAFRLQSRFMGGIDFFVAPLSRSVEESFHTPTSVNFKAGYKFGSMQVMGLLGIQYLNSENFIPIGLEAKKYFSTAKWAPFVYARGGYAFHLKRNIHSRYNTADYAQYDPSLFVSGGVGYSLVTPLNEFYMSLGFLYHELEEIMAEQVGDVRTDLTMKGVALTLGFTF